MTAKDELEKLDREWMSEEKLHGSMQRLQLIYVGLGILMVAGGIIVCFGYWMWDHWKGPQGDVPGYCCIFGGAGILALSFVFMLPTARRIRERNQTRCIYECRREELLQEIYANGHDKRDEENSEVDTST